MPENRYPDVVKRDKVPYQGSFEEIAVSAVNNDRGKIEDNGNGLVVSEELAEHLRLLEQQAIETGFQVGFQQAEIMGKVIPQVTIMRLKEMIATGELRQNFEQFWREAAAQLGNAQSLTELGSGKWQEYQLEKYQPLT